MEFPAVKKNAVVKSHRSSADPGSFERHLSGTAAGLRRGLFYAFKNAPWITLFCFVLYLFVSKHHDVDVS